MQTSRIAVIAGLFSILSITAAPLARSSEGERAYWTALGTRWAAKHDASGETQAIYDLSYPYLFMRVKLATLDLSKKAIADARKDLTEARAENGGERSARIRALDALEKVRIKPNWWKDLSFKDSRINQGDAPPERFRLSELALLNRKGRALDWRQFVPAKQQRLIAEAGPEDLDFFSLDSLELQLECNSEDGSPVYGIYWSPIDEGRAKAMDPRKIVDFRSPGWLLAKSLAIDALQTALGALVGEIGIPVVSSLVGTVTGTFFRYRDLLNRSHIRMASEMLHVAEDGQAGQTELSPFQGWTGDPRRMAVLSLAYGDAALTDLALWIFNPPIKAWDKSFNQERKTARKLEKRLSKKGVVSAYVNPRFAVGKWPDGRTRLYQMGRNKVIGLPSKSIDYGKPNLEKNTRPAIATGEVLVDFVTGFIPIPFVGSVISGAYSLLLSNPMRASISQEAQLIAYLEEIPVSEESPLNAEETLDILYGQRLNPLALDRARSQALIRLRKQHLGI